MLRRAQSSGPMALLGLPLPCAIQRRTAFIYGNSPEAHRLRGEKPHEEDRYDNDEDTQMTIDAAHTILGTNRFDSLARIKLSYLLKCRQHHPEVRGDPNMYYKTALAYECLLAERGVEMRDGTIQHSDLLPKRAKTERLLANVTRPTLIAGAHDLVHDIDRYAHLTEGSGSSETEKLPTDEMSAAERLEARETKQKEKDNEERQKLVEARRSEESSHSQADQAQNKAPQEAIKREETSTSATASATTTGAAAATFGSGGAQISVSGEHQKEVAADSSATLDQTEEDEGSSNAALDKVAGGTSTELEPDGTRKKPDALSHAAFDQMTVEHLSRLPADLTPDTKLAPEEEEAVVRRILAEEMDKGPLAGETVMDYLDKSVSVAGYGSRCATEIMYNTKERQAITREAMLLYVNFLVIFFLGMTVAFAYKRYQARIKKQPRLAEHLSMDTLLPWWGNDDEYERQVKRLFVEEWKKAKQKAHHANVFQAGTKNEKKSLEEREEQDKDIFRVTADDLQKMREEAEGYKEKRKTGLGAMSSTMGDDGLPAESRIQVSAPQPKK